LSKHLWAGKFIDDSQLESKLSSLGEEISPGLNSQFNHDHLYSACCKLEMKLDGSDSKNLEVMPYLQASNLKLKLKRELGTITPFDLLRPDLQEAIFEAYRPLGTLVHILPGNADALIFLSAIEGLLSGNINILKVSSKSKDANYYVELLQQLTQQDESGQLEKMLYVVNLESSQQELVSALLSCADGVTVWGGDQAVAAITQQVKPGTRVIPWGHKMSCIYLEQGCLEDDRYLTDLASKVVALEQQACSSPQIIYVESQRFSDLEQLANRLAPILDQVSKSVDPLEELTLGEQAEIKNVSEMVRLESLIGKERRLIEDKNSGQWRILVSDDSTFSPSPLFRTIWIKPLLMKEIISTLLPVRRYLQTVGLISKVERMASIIECFIQAGVTRVTSVEGMLDSYLGSPHDGEYALNRYLKRISVKLDQELPTSLARISDLSRVDKHAKGQMDVNLMDKPALQSLVAGQVESINHLYFKSGGSSGAPVLSPFSYQDYHSQMRFAAEGILAAGLAPKVDRVMNLFFGGALYGGFLSFFSILEQLKCCQFPMAAINDYQMVIDTIIDQKVDTLLGMPSYIIPLFQKGHQQLAAYQGVKKIFFGGEHMGHQQMSWLKEEFGVTLIRAAAYGSVDAGPLGYQCADAPTGTYHLHQDLHQLELIQLEQDLPVDDDQQVGRLVFSTPSREAVPLKRYLIGDLGCWVSSPCPCQRLGRRFKLLGREGDIFKAGGTFLNYGRFYSILEEGIPSLVEMQLIIDQVDFVDRLTLSYVGSVAIDEVERLVSSNYHDLYQAWKEEQGMLFDVRSVAPEDLLRTAVGKLIKIVDHRGSNE
jgi:phenylacetate-coenzyme A ligase PaaK-like adenylate-forming protein